MNTYETPLAALAEPTRRAILEELRKGPASVGDIAGRLPVSRPAVSQHLKVLKDARLVSDRPTGTRRVYSLSGEGLAEVREYLDRFWDDALEAYRTAAEKEAGRDG